MTDMVCAPDAPGFAAYQIQVAGGLQQLAFRGLHTRHRLAEKGLRDCLGFHGIAPPLENAAPMANAPYLPGLKKIFHRAMG